MESTKKTNALLSEYANTVKEIYGNTLNKIILYGSYARGDYKNDSDIDIMILLNVPHEQERDKIRELIDATCDFNMEHNLDIQPIPKSDTLFQKWQNVLPFYKNIA
ncbi:MAG: nucleotidyltransferase domain-containing protein, partial [Schwartzia sp.]|nr:nucleotidyltransferase domain-containing protein [Schwartzia sp. (in: firmicutes)]